jgi:hypothetical protein
MDAVSVASQKFIDQQIALHKVASLDLLPREVRKQIKKEAKRIATEDVFGVGHKTDKQGNPIEQGVGAPGNITQQHIDAYVKAQTDSKLRPGGPEAGYEDHLKRMRAQLAECNAKRRAEMIDEDDED